MRNAIIGFVILAAAAISILLWQQRRPQPFEVSGFIEADEIRVGSQVGGRVTDVLVSEGERVSTGDVIFRLGPFDLLQELAKAEADLAAKRAAHLRISSGFRKEEIEQARAQRDALQAKLDKLTAGVRPQEVDIAQSRLGQARTQLAFLESEYQRIQKLHEKQQAASREFDDAQRARDSALADVAVAERQLNLLQEGARKEEIAEARSALAAAAAELVLREKGYRSEDIAAAKSAVDAAAAGAEAIRIRVSELEVRSPCDCVVSAIDLRPGDLVAPNMPSAALLDLSRLWVRAYVPENRLREIRVDQQVPVRVDSWGDRHFKGRLAFLADDAEFTPKNVQTPENRSKLVFRVKVMIEEGGDDLRVGMGADVLFGEAAK